MAAQHHPSQGPALLLRQRRAEDAVAWRGGLAVGHQVQAPPRKEHGIQLRRGEEAFQAQGLVLRGAQAIEFVGLGDDVLAGSVLVAADDSRGVDRSVRFGSAPRNGLEILTHCFTMYGCHLKQMACRIRFMSMNPA